MTSRGLLRLGIITCLIRSCWFSLSRDSVLKTWSQWTLPLSGKVIALDAGHGGADGGAASQEGVIEKDLNLAIVLYLSDYLQQAGAWCLSHVRETTDLGCTRDKGIF